MENNIFGERVKKARLDSNMTMEELSKLSQTTKGTIWKIESGKTKCPNVVMAKNISISLNVSLDWLLGITDNSNNNNDLNILYNKLNYEDKEKVLKYINTLLGSD